MRLMVMIMYKTKILVSKSILRETSESLRTVAHKNWLYHSGKVLDMPLCLPLEFHSLPRCEAGICKYGPWAKSSLPPVSVNKVLSEQSTAPTYVLSVAACLLPRHSRSPNRDLKFWLFGPWQKKLANPSWRVMKKKKVIFEFPAPTNIGAALYGW